MSMSASTAGTSVVLTGAASAAASSVTWAVAVAVGFSMGFSVTPDTRAGSIVRYETQDRGGPARGTGVPR